MTIMEKKKKNWKMEKKNHAFEIGDTKRGKWETRSYKYG